MKAICSPFYLARIYAKPALYHPLSLLLTAPQRAPIPYGGEVNIVLAPYMGDQMNKSAKQNNKQTRLKSHKEESHNHDLALIDLVKLLARALAEEDYKLYADQLSNQKLEGEE